MLLWLCQSTQKHTVMNAIEITFWASAFIVFYTYLGYGILLFILVHIKELFKKPKKLTLPHNLPHVTLLIAAYNEEKIVYRKMENTLDLDYPSSKLTIAWVTDGSNDRTNEYLAKYLDVKVMFDPARKGKSAAVDRAMGLLDTPIVIFTDANTMLSRQAIKLIVAQFTDPRVGCVAGEKRVWAEGAEDATAGEGVYWRYESTLKALDYRLYSAVGAAGELFAIRRSLYESLDRSTLLDDFILSMKIAQKGYKIAYCKEASATEEASASIVEEAKRKVRIAAGGLQSIARLAPLLNIFRYGTLSFQYISHRVLRWSLTPILFFALMPLNIVLVINYGWDSLYGVLLVCQIIFYTLSVWGFAISSRQIKSRIIFIPYYFMFMNVCVFKGAIYLIRHRTGGIWEKAKRKNE